MKINKTNEIDTTPISISIRLKETDEPYATNTPIEYEKTVDAPYYQLD